MKRISTDRHLTADEAAKYNLIREQVASEFPPVNRNQILTTNPNISGPDKLEYADTVCFVYDSDDLMGSQTKAREAGAPTFMVTRGDSANVAFWVNASPDAAPYRIGLVLQHVPPADTRAALGQALQQVLQSILDAGYIPMLRCREDVPDIEIYSANWMYISQAK